VQTTDHEMIPAVGELAGVSGAVHGTAGYRWDYWTDLVGTTDFDYGTRTDNIEHFEKCVVNEYTVRMLVG